MDVDKVNNLIATIEKNINALKNEVNGTNVANVTVTFGKKSREIYTSSEPAKPKPAGILKLIGSSDWPEAVPEDLLCSTDHEEKLARAEGILDSMIDRDMNGKRFLDYGCGDGYLSFAMLDRGVEESAGYDHVSKIQGWTMGPFGEDDRLWYTENAQDIEPPDCKPWDVISLYDVLDHCERPLEVLNRCKRSLAPDGIIYVHCHPWASRHGGHLYRTINKAYAHVALTDEEIGDLCGKVDTVKKVLRPLKTYKEWFNVAGLKVCREDIKPANPVEPFFKENVEVRECLLRHWEQERNREPKLNDDQIFTILGLEFIDFVLKSNK